MFICSTYCLQFRRGFFVVWSMVAPCSVAACVVGWRVVVRPGSGWWRSVGCCCKRTKTLVDRCRPEESRSSRVTSRCRNDSSTKWKTARKVSRLVGRCLSCSDADVDCSGWWLSRGFAEVSGSVSAVHGAAAPEKGHLVSWPRVLWVRQKSGFACV